MKYGIRTEIPGMTQEQYDQVHAIFEPKARAARGALFHAAGPTADGWYTFEVWESREDYERFIKDEVTPVIGADSPMPPMQEMEVYTAESYERRIRFDAGEETG